jgi:hypothetical protein
MATSLNDRVAILAELSLAYTNDWLDKPVTDFCVANNIAIPLAFAVDYGYGALTDKGTEIINITFDNLLTLAGLKDEGFQELSDLFEDED